MSAAETTAAVPAEEVKAVETPAPAPEAAPATETPAVVSSIGRRHLLLFTPISGGTQGRSQGRGSSRC